jgi:hypothetical protein
MHKNIASNAAKTDLFIFIGIYLLNKGMKNNTCGQRFHLPTNGVIVQKHDFKRTDTKINYLVPNAPKKADAAGAV